MPKRIAMVVSIALSAVATLLAWLMAAQGFGVLSTSLAVLSSASLGYLLLLEFTSLDVPRKNLVTILSAAVQVVVVAVFVLRVWVLPNETLNRLRRQVLVDRNPTATQHIYLFTGTGALLLHNEVLGKVTRAWSTMDREIKRNPGTGSFVYYFTRDGQFRQTNAPYILSSHPIDFDPVTRVEYVGPDAQRSPPERSKRSAR